MKEKEEKMKSILSYALCLISGLTSNRKEILHPQKSFETTKIRNYFYFNGSESGL